jgi:hypothetical protein
VTVLWVYESLATGRFGIKNNLGQVCGSNTTFLFNYRRSQRLITTFAGPDASSRELANLPLRPIPMMASSGAWMVMGFFM